MDDRREALNEIDRTLAEALDVDVSPDFMARVRQRVASEPMRAPFWHGWRLVVPVAAAAIVVVAVVVTLRPAQSPAPASLSARSLPPESGQPAGVRPAPPVAASDPSPRIARARAAAVPGVVNAPPEPEVLVPREEIEMYRRLMAQARNAPGALLVAAPPDIVAVRSISEISIDPIKSDPIKIALIIPSVDGEEGDRQ